MRYDAGRVVGTVTTARELVSRRRPRRPCIHSEAMPDQETKELDAFFAFFGTFDLARPVSTVSDLSDGAALFEILSLV